MTEDERMLMSILNCRRGDLFTDSKRLTDEQETQFAEMRRRRAGGEPLQYILGQCDFMGNTIAVNPSVFIPRLEGEVLVKTVVDQSKTLPPKGILNILELGTGSGNIAIALAKSIPHAEIIALDIDQGAITTANKNATTNGVHSSIRFLKVDMVAFLKESAEQYGKYDIIISNPPYVPTAQFNDLPEDAKREPRIALNGGEDGLYFYKPIARYAHKFLKPNGILIFEIGYENRNAIENIFKQYPPYKSLDFYKDHNGADRIASVRLKTKWVWPFFLKNLLGNATSTT